MEVDLFKGFGVRAGGGSHDVVLNHMVIVRFQRSRYRCNSLSIAQEVYLYLRSRSLPLNLVGAGLKLSAADLYWIQNLNRPLVLVTRKGAQRQKGKHAYKCREFHLL